VANEWGDQPAAATTAPAVNEWGDAAAGGAAQQPGALSQIGTSLKNQAKGLLTLLQVPFSQDKADQVARGIVDSHVEQFEKAKASFKSGDYAAALHHGLGAAIPLIGPAIEQTAEKATTGGRPWEAATDILAAPLLGKGLEMAPQLAEAAGTAGTALKAGAKAGGAQVATGTAKVGGGAAIAAIPLPSWLKGGAEFELGRQGIRDIAQGAKTGYNAAKQAFENAKAARLAAAAPAPAEAAASAAPAAAAAPAPAENPAKAAFDKARIPPDWLSPAQAETEAHAANSAKAAADYAAAPRKAKVNALADTLHGEISSEDAAKLSPHEWNRLADALGINRPSPTTVKATIEELQAREAAADLNRDLDATLAMARAKPRPAPRTEDPAKVAAAIEDLKAGPKPTLASKRAKKP